MPLTTGVGRLRLSSSTVLSAEVVTMSNKDALFRNNQNETQKIHMYNVKRGKLSETSKYDLVWLLKLNI